MTKKSDRRIKRWMTALFQGRFSGLMEKTWNSNSLESQKNQVVSKSWPKLFKETPITLTASASQLS